MRWRACALMLAAAAAGCAQPIKLQPQAVQVGADGRYRGTVLLVRAESRYCPHSGPRVLEVYGGSITLSYSGDSPRSRVALTAPIAGNGRIQASDGIGAIDGQYRDGRIAVTVASRACEHRWNLAKVG